jgi:hypothetical protein
VTGLAELPHASYGGTAQFMLYAFFILILVTAIRGR